MDSIANSCICTHLYYICALVQRKTALGNDSQLVVRLPAALVGRVDQFAEHMRAELPGTRFARAEAVRVLLTRALDQVSAKGKR